MMCTHMILRQWLYPQAETLCTVYQKHLHEQIKQVESMKISVSLCQTHSPNLADLAKAEDVMQSRASVAEIERHHSRPP